MPSRKLPRSFYARPTLTVARELLGMHIVRRVRNHLLIGKIVEVEAYRGEDDPASHAYRGKTLRNDVMFGPPGHLYVYFTYGMHFCANIVTERDGKAGAVLIRAVEPIASVDIMRRNRGHTSDRNLTNGPAKFCQAFRIGRKENGIDLLGADISVTEGKPVPSSLVARSPRIGIREGTAKRWRFSIRGNAWVSRA